jgi:hypothetical protein
VLATQAAKSQPVAATVTELSVFHGSKSPQEDCVSCAPQFEVAAVAVALVPPAAQVTPEHVDAVASAVRATTESNNKVFTMFWIGPDN